MMEQIPLTDLTQPVQNGRLYLLTAVLHVDGGLAFGGYEWHEKYVAKLSSADVSDRQLLEALHQTHQFKKGVIIETGGGPRIKIGNATIFFVREPIAPMLARQILEQKILPVLQIIKKTEL